MEYVHQTGIIIWNRASRNYKKMNLSISYEKYSSCHYIEIGLWNFISLLREIDNDKELNLHLLISDLICQKNTEKLYRK